MRHDGVDSFHRHSRHPHRARNRTDRSRRIVGPDLDIPIHARRDRAIAPALNRRQRLTPHNRRASLRIAQPEHAVERRAQIDRPRLQRGDQRRPAEQLFHPECVERWTPGPPDHDPWHRGRSDRRERRADARSGVDDEQVFRPNDPVGARPSHGAATTARSVTGDAPAARCARARCRARGRARPAASRPSRTGRAAR